MALTWGAKEKPDMWVSERRLFLAADGVTVVEADDPRAAFLLVGAGCEMPLAEARRLGLAESPGRPARSARANRSPAAPPAGNE